MIRRFRFSIRTLAIVVTLISAYFGAWEATKRYVRSLQGIDWEETDAARKVVWGMTAEFPLVVSQREVVTYDKMKRKWETDYVSQKHYYVWLFVWTIELPIESNEVERGIPNLPLRTQAA